MEASLLTKSSCSFRFEPLVKTKKSLRNRLLGIAKRSNFFQFQRLTFGIASNEQFHIHTIISGETLTSISKKYGVSIYAIAAANMEIKDVDLVLEGQRLNIPINVVRHTFPFSHFQDLQKIYSYQLHRCHRLLDESLVPKSQKLISGIHSSFPSKIDLQKTYNYQLHRCHRLLDENLVPRSREMICTINSNFPSKIIKPSSYFVVLVPLVAFFIGCVIGVFHHNLAKSSRPHGANAGRKSHKTRGTRWKAVIYESECLNNSDADPQEKPCKPSEEQPQLLFERPHHDYGKVESEYSKFLSDCGVSSYGYWRGGTTE